MEQPLRRTKKEAAEDFDKRAMDHLVELLELSTEHAVAFRNANHH